MKQVWMTDATLRTAGAAGENRLSFREKTEIVRQLEKLHVDGIQLPPIADESDEKARKTDLLFVRTAARLCGKSVLSLPVGMTQAEVDLAWQTLREAACPQLHVILPVSPVQMEYVCRRKPAVMLQLIRDLVSYCRSLCPDVAFTAVDATRAEPTFLAQALEAAVEAGTTTLTICDTAGSMMPGEYAEFLGNAARILREKAEGRTLRILAECSDELSMAQACAFAALQGEADGMVTTLGRSALPTLEAAAHVLQTRGGTLGLTGQLQITGLRRALSQMRFLAASDGKNDGGEELQNARESGFALHADATPEAVEEAVVSLGYELSGEDQKKVYAAFRQTAAGSRRAIGPRELDAIVADSALEVTPTYLLRGYHVTTTGVPDSGGVSAATAQVVLQRDGKNLRGLADGEGPVDAALRAIEQAAGCHYELDQFRVESVTEGREALGSAVVRLRAGGRLYGGAGLSSDIVAASIRAYLGALNKIMAEEGGVTV